MSEKSLVKIGSAQDLADRELELRGMRSPRQIDNGWLQHGCYAGFSDWRIKRLHLCSISKLIETERELQSLFEPLGAKRLALLRQAAHIVANSSAVELYLADWRKIEEAFTGRF